MTKVIAMTAEPRERAGKGTARQTRRDGRVPAVVYGDKKPPTLIALDTIALTKALHKPGFFTHLVDISLNGSAQRCLPRDVQLDPVTDRPLHVDFLRVNANSTIVVAVPVEFMNHDKCPGLKAGGVLNVIHHTMDLECRVTDIPEKITVDLSGLDIGDSIHLKNVSLPSGVTSASTEEDYTVATIGAPSKVEVEAPPAAATTPAAGTPAAPATGTSAAPAAGS